MMRMLRSRWLWSMIALAAGAWTVRAVRNGSREAKAVTARRARAMWGKAARTGRNVRPTALSMAARAGRAMMDTTMRTVRAMQRD